MYADARRYTEPRLPNQRWQMYPANPTLAQRIANTHQLSPLIAQVAINRGADSLGKARDYLNPELLDLPHPLEEFPDLAFSIELLESAIASGEKIAICGVIVATN
ncbi:MAG: hypothetical protein F6K32_11045, partial [Desertifilum sp. SIO1I2]|nr:hypothetical protein [Desertifilum sp. SIO1I2]